MPGGEESDLARKHGARQRKAQDRRNRDRQHSKPQPAGEPDRKPEPAADPRDVASGWLRGVG